MLRKLIIAGSIAAAATGLAVPAAASAHDYHGGGYYGGHGYYGGYHRDWRSRHRWHRDRWHNRWYGDRDYRWGRHHRYWRGYDRYHRHHGY